MKYLLSTFLFIITISLSAQPEDLPWDTDPECGTIVTDGIAAITCGSTSDVPYNERFAFGLVDIKDALPNSGRVDMTEFQDVYHHPSWHVDSIGNVFGVTMDACGNTYVCASTNYAPFFVFAESIIRFGELGGGTDDVNAAGTVYKIDGKTGQASVFCVIPQMESQILHRFCFYYNEADRNTGPALGNIAFNERTDEFYVTSFEDSRIYRIDHLGAIIDSYDPLDYDDGEPGVMDKFQLTYGITVSPDGNELFFGTSGMISFDNFPESEFEGNYSYTNYADIYSVELNTDGSFVGTVDNSILPMGANWDNYIGENTLHYRHNVGTVFSEQNWFAISDLEFTPDGKLLVGVRSSCTDDMYSSLNHLGASVVLTEDNGLYQNVEGTLVISNNFGEQYDAYGGVSSYTSPGGVEQIISTGSDMLDPSGPHGLHISEVGNYGNVNNPITPAGVISYNPSFNVYTEPKGIGGDVYVYKDCNQRHCDILNSSSEIEKDIRALTVSPNPFNGGFYLDFYSENAQEVLIKLYTASGTLLCTLECNIVSGSNEISIMEEVLRNYKGVILCELRTEASSSVIKLISQ